MNYLTGSLRCLTAVFILAIGLSCPGLADTLLPLEKDHRFIENALALEHEDLVPTFHSVELIGIKFRSSWGVDIDLDNTDVRQKLGALARQRLKLRLQELGLESVKVLGDSELATVAERCALLDIFFTIYLQKVRKLELEGPVLVGAVHVETSRHRQDGSFASAPCVGTLKEERGVSTMRLFLVDDPSSTETLREAEAAVGEALDRIVLYLAVANRGAMSTIHEWVKRGTADGRKTD